MSKVLVEPRRSFLKTVVSIAVGLVVGCTPSFNKLHTRQELQQKLDSMFGFRVYAVSIGESAYPQLDLPSEMVTKLSKRTRLVDLTPVEVDLLYRYILKYNLV